MHLRPKVPDSNVVASCREEDVGTDAEGDVGNVDFTRWAADWTRWVIDNKKVTITSQTGRPSVESGNKYKVV